MSVMNFIKQGVRYPKEMGALFPSSGKLAEVIAEAADIRRAKTVLELGPGTGALTKHLVKHLSPEAWFLAIELNEELLAEMREALPEVNVVHGDAGDAPRFMAEAGIECCDCVISGLPWAAFEDPLQDRLLDVLDEVLCPGGTLTAYTYVQSPLLPKGRRFREKLETRFKSVEKTPIVWRNLPPAFAYHATK